MPVIGAIVGAVTTGLVWWLFFGRGLEYIDHRLSAAGAARRRARSRATAEAIQRTAPLKSVADPRDAAAILMMLACLQRGVPTPEQAAAVEAEMRGVLALGDETAPRAAAARFAAEQSPCVDSALEHLAPLLRANLTGEERRDLVAMLERVAAVHGGPTPEQERLINLVARAMARG
jgi:hypothetical protein